MQNKGGVRGPKSNQETKDIQESTKRVKKGGGKGKRGEAITSSSSSKIQTLSACI